MVRFGNFFKEFKTIFLITLRCFTPSYKNIAYKIIKKKIISLGLKPVSAIVDATNYVMFDLNRPLHAYDADKINKEIIVRNSKKGESFEALDNKKYILQNNMCAITDKSGVLGLGGIIGGTRSGTEFSTKNIFFGFFLIISLVRLPVPGPTSNILSLSFISPISIILFIMLISVKKFCPKLFFGIIFTLCY